MVGLASLRLDEVVELAAGERESIAALSPRFGACIPRDQTIRFSPSVLKGALAEGIFRLSVAARETQGASR